MLSATNISKSYGVNVVLKDISFNISSGEKVGLIGPNGCGKSTLLRILAGVEQPDRGKVSHTLSGIRIGYLAQGLEISQDLPIGTFLSHKPASWNDAPAFSSVGNLYAGSIPGNLGILSIPPETPIGHLSGGQKTRLMLAKILMDDPNLLLLDEPTNHLDIDMLGWLEAWVNHFRGAILVVSHDRSFLDNTIETICELDPTSMQTNKYIGNYSDYIQEKIRQYENHEQAYSDQQAKLEQLRAAANQIRGLTRMKKGGKSDSGDKFAKGFFGNRATKNTAGRAKNIEARIEKILTVDHVAPPRTDWQIKLDFANPAHKSRDVFSASNLSIGYPGSTAILSNLNISIASGQRIALIGANGCGKTTLLRTITGALQPKTGTIQLGAKIKVGYMTQEQELINLNLSPLQIIQKTSNFNETETRHFLHYFLFGGDDPLRKCSELSFGERARLQLAILVSSGCSFLLMDEPINHLDIPSRASFEQALLHFEGTILMVSHDRYFIKQIATEVWSLENGQIRKSN